jgi:2,4-dienoyl-CoA reductase-like NADH-dependent reductase (Old Yellow Enzyme family)
MPSEQDSMALSFTVTHIHIPSLLSQKDVTQNFLAANGYLFDTFIHDNINDRTDQYGGSLKNRLRFTLEVVDAVVAAIGKERTAIRLSPFVVLSQALDSDRITTYSKYSEELEKRGLAYVHMIEARYVNRIRGKTEAERREQEKAETDPRYTLWTFRRILKTTPLIGAGGYTAKSARDAISEGWLLCGGDWCDVKLIGCDRESRSYCFWKRLHF